MKHRKSSKPRKEPTLSVTLLPNGLAYAIPMEEGKDPNKCFQDYVRTFEALYTEHQSDPDVYEIIAREMGLRRVEDVVPSGLN